MRIFIALLFNRQVKDNLYSYIENLAEKYQGNYTTYNNLHLTLFYIGELDRETIEKVIDSIKTINYYQFTYVAKKLGSFKNANKHKLVHFEVDNNYELNNLHKLTINALIKAGIKIDNANFTPHITIGRKVEISDQELSMIKVEEMHITANRISVMVSKRVNGELIYEEIDYNFLKK
jgi:2'-5' RNA ligase